MDFFINKNSTLPILKMKLITDDEIDYQSFNELLKNCAITFSMVNTENNTYKIANKEGLLIINENPNKFSNQHEFYIGYNWGDNDTNKTGTFIGEFKIDFIDAQCKTLIVPIKEKLYIHIEDSITKSEFV